MKDNKSHVVSVRLTDSQYEALTKLAASGSTDKGTPGSALLYLLQRFMIQG